MALLEMEIPPGPADVTARFSALLDAADARIRSIYGSPMGDARRGFIPSDFAAVYAVLRYVAERNLAPGRRFCEWGSGLGVVASLAALLGFEAYGIELQEELVESSRRLAGDFGVEVTFVCDTFVPTGFDFFTDAIAGSKQLIRTSEEGPGAEAAHPGLGLNVEDFDMVFIYPWPGEAQFVEELFEAAAAEEALLLTYHGQDDLRLRRKRTRPLEGASWG